MQICRSLSQSNKEVQDQDCLWRSPSLTEMVGIRTMSYLVIDDSEKNVMFSIPEEING